MFPELEVSDNNLVNVIKFIKDGNIVALYTRQACRVFHLVGTDQLETTRVVYVGCDSNPGLLDDGEWEYYIKEQISNVVECGIDNTMRSTIIAQREVPHKRYISLGY